MTKLRCITKRVDLYYGWVECDETHDGAIFCRAMSCILGWRNILQLLPKKEKSGKYLLDSAHRDIPIKKIWNTYLLLPRDNSQESQFIAKWVFSPGVKVVSDKEAKLTISSDATVMADIMAIGGHGGSGTASGQQGGEVNIKKMLEEYGGKTPKDALKYLIIATCGSIDYGLGKMWLKAFLKDNPVRGILGYTGGYKTSIAPYIMQRFVKQLAKGKTVLEAWQRANKESKLDTWSCFVHDTAKTDTVADWTKNKLPKIDKNKKVRYYDKDTYTAGGVAVTTEPLPYEAFFYMGKDRIDDSNNDSSSYGLFPGDSGYLLIKSNKGNFVAGDKITLIFNYWRFDKKGMDLNKLLDIDYNKLGLKPKHLNSLIKTKDIDGFEYQFTGKEKDEFKIPYKVQDGALKTYELVPGTNKYGYFWILFKHSREAESINLKFYGAHLYTPRAYLWFVNTDTNQEFKSKGKRDKVWTIPAGSRFCVDVYGLQKHDSLEISVFTKKGKQIALNSIMIVPFDIRMRSFWRVSDDQKSIYLKGNDNRFIATMKNLQDSNAKRLMGQTLYFRLKYNSSNGMKTLDVKNDFFKFAKPLKTAGNKKKEAPELYYMYPDTLAELSRTQGKTGPFKLPANTEVQIVFQKVRAYLNKWASVYDETGSRVAFNKLFTVKKSKDYDISPDTITLHIRAKVINVKVLDTKQLKINKVMGKVFHFKLGYFTQQGNKEVTFSHDTFTLSDNP